MDVSGNVIPCASLGLVVDIPLEGPPSNRESGLCASRACDCRVFIFVLRICSC